MKLKITMLDKFHPDVTLRSAPFFPQENRKLEQIHFMIQQQNMQSGYLSWKR